MSAASRSRVRARAVALLLATAVAVPAAACINETGTTLKGRHVALDFGPMMTRADLMYDGTDRVASYTGDVIARAKERGDFDSLNDLAATTIRLGRAESAVRLLLSLEKRWPGRYETATNLGTAYELLGRNEDALRWIREGLARNPRSHWGTEWVHVRILEAKIAAGARPAASGGSLLGLDFGDDTVPVVPAILPAGNDGEPVDLWGLAQGLRIQLAERTDLVAPPDPVVSNLMLDLATLELAAGSVENATVIYDLAMDYGAPRTPLLAARIAAAEAAAKRGAMVHEDDRRYGTCAICAPPEEPGGE